MGSGSQILQGTSSSMGSSLCRTTGPDRSLLQHGSPRGSQPSWGTLLLHVRSSMAAAGTAVSPRSAPEAAGEPLSVLLPRPGCLQSSFPPEFSFLSSGCCCTAVFFFVNTLSQSCYHCCWRALPWPVMGLPWTHLALTLGNMGKASSNSHSSHPTVCPATKILPCEPNTTRW